MDRKEMAVILNNHKLWLDGDNVNGKQAKIIGESVCLQPLNKSDLRYSDLCGTNFTFSDLSESDLSESDLRAIIGSANFDYADFNKANMEGANMQGASLIGSDLSDTNLHYANLTNADLHGANLSNANLNDADFNNANIEDCSFPLSEKGLSVNLDNDGVALLLYHAVQNALYSHNTSLKLKRLLGNEEILEFLNDWVDDKQNKSGYKKFYIFDEE